MIPLWTPDEVIIAVHGKTLHDNSWSANGVSIDTRSLSKGDIFIALPGSKSDGHDFVGAAFAAGASAAIVSHQPSGVDAGSPLIIVPDTMNALTQLGQAARIRTGATLVAVTGSVGKTSTKEMLRVILSSLGNATATQGNLNNHIGVPLSLARLPAKLDWGIIEMGMNHAGEISVLSKYTRPHVSLITAIEAVHLENFDDITGIADAKAEIFDGHIGIGGAAVIIRDTPHYARLAAAARKSGIKNVVSFGSSARADMRLLRTATDDDIMVVDAALNGRKLQFTLATQGAHFARNALGALLAASMAGADIGLAADALSAWRPSSGRGGRRSVILPSGEKIILFDETYNASPASMRAAIETLAAHTPQAGGRRIAILGDMLELGATAGQLHQDLAEVLTRSGIDVVYTCGALMRHLDDALPSSMRGTWSPTSQELAVAVKQSLKDGDIVMIKGSNSMKMKEIVKALSD